MNYLSLVEGVDYFAQYKQGLVDITALSQSNTLVIRSSVILAASKINQMQFARKNLLLFPALSS